MEKKLNKSQFPTTKDFEFSDQSDLKSFLGKEPETIEEDNDLLNTVYQNKLKENKSPEEAQLEIDEQLQKIQINKLKPKNFEELAKKYLQLKGFSPEDINSFKFNFLNTKLFRVKYFLYRFNFLNSLQCFYYFLKVFLNIFSQLFFASSMFIHSTFFRFFVFSIPCKANNYI
jgi:hypothetical protein